MLSRKSLIRRLKQRPVEEAESGVRKIEHPTPLLKPHSQQEPVMPRRLRIEFPGGVYHVFNRGVLRQYIVRSDSVGREDSGGFIEWTITARGAVRFLS